MSENTAIVGMGVVGSALQKVLDVPVYFDRIKERCNCTLKEVSKQQVIFMCLPTPTGIDGKQENVHIEDLIKQIAEYGNRNFFVIRSTVIPGTTRRIKNNVGVQVIHNPEFLSEDTAFEDTMKPDFIAIGSDKDCEPARLALLDVYKNSSVVCDNYLFADTVTTETLKYAMNCFFATKVTYANLIKDICDINMANYDFIRDAMYLSKYIGKNHLDVDHKGYRGYGGMCLPKDMKAMNGYIHTRLLGLVDQLNNENKWI